MKVRSKYPMITLGDCVLIAIPLISYGLTSISLLLMPLPVAVLYSIFSAFKRHHENQPFVEPKKIKMYTNLHFTFKLGLILTYWFLELLAIYLSAN